MPWRSTCERAHIVSGQSVDTPQGGVLLSFLGFTSAAQGDLPAREHVGWSSFRPCVWGLKATAGASPLTPPDLSNTSVTNNIHHGRIPLRCDRTSPLILNVTEPFLMLLITPVHILQRCANVWQLHRCLICEQFGPQIFIAFLLRGAYVCMHSVLQLLIWTAISAKMRVRRTHRQIQ